MIDSAITITILTIGWFVGYGTRDVHDRLKSLQRAIKSHVVKERTEAKPESKSFIVEPLTPEQQARKDLEERVKRLNP